MNDAVSPGMLSLQWRRVEIHPERPPSYRRRGQQ